MIWFFTHLTRLLMWVRFKNVHVAGTYNPNGSNTVYYLNHNYWWDGLIPLYLNHHFFKQNARALMEDTQMRKHPFFSKIGAFSINLSNPRSAISSLRFALESLKQANMGIYIYPEGKIVPPSNQVQSFKTGLAWLAKECPDVDFVPISIHIDYSKISKPELNLLIGEKQQVNISQSKTELTRAFEQSLNELIRQNLYQIYQVHS